MGCSLAMLMPEESPLTITKKQAAKPKTEPTAKLAFANFTSRLRKRNQQLTPTTKMEPVIHPLETVWRNFTTAVGEKATAANDTISFRTVSGLNSIPTGCCIQALATKIHHAEIVAPNTVSQVEAKWNLRLTLFQPKNIMAINVASIKNATIPSMANGAPKMSPTIQE